MIIQAKQQTLRTFGHYDALAFYRLSHDEEVKKYVPYAYTEDLKEAEEMVEYYSEGDCKNDFYLIIEEDEAMVGVIIAVRTIKNTLEVSAFVSKHFRGRGIMTKAMETFKEWLSKNTNYEKLVMCIEKENVASNCQIRKIGGKFVETLENNNVYEIVIK